MTCWGLTSAPHPPLGTISCISTGDLDFAIWLPRLWRALPEDMQNQCHLLGKQILKVRNMIFLKLLERHVRVSLNHSNCFPMLQLLFIVLFHFVFLWLLHKYMFANMASSHDSQLWLQWMLFSKHHIQSHCWCLFMTVICLFMTFLQPPPILI